MHEVIISKIQIHELQDEQLIFLKEKAGSRIFPVVIGVAEVNAIKLCLSGIHAPRPMTHDLLKSTIEALGGTVKRIIIDSLENNTFFAKIVLTDKEGKEIRVDARPSDSIALAVRLPVPIFVEDSVLDEVGMTPDA